MAGAYPAGIGNAQQAMQATAAMRQSPWYAALVRSWGYDPTQTDSNGNLTDKNGKSIKLSDKQQQQMIATARDNGVGISDSYSIDENGQIAKPDSHMLRNIAIAAGIAGLAVTGLGAAGIGPLAGVFGAGAGGAGAVGADLAGAEALGGGGVIAGLPGAMATLPAIGGGVGTAAAAGGTAAKIAAAAKAAAAAKSGTSTLTSILGAAGKGVGDAATASGQNRLDQEKLGIEAAPIDLAQRRAALQDIARASGAANPSRSPFDIAPPRGMTDQYKSTLSQLAAQGQQRLQSPLSNITPSTVQDATGTKKGTLETIGDYASPILTVGSKIPWDKIF